jgi:hypothetical protein
VSFSVNCDCIVVIAMLNRIRLILVERREASAVDLGREKGGFRCFSTVCPSAVYQNKKQRNVTTPQRSSFSRLQVFALSKTLSLSVPVTGLTVIRNHHGGSLEISIFL